MNNFLSNYFLGGNNILYMLAASALLFAGYWLLMRKEKRHQMVRFYLLGCLVLALLVPLSPKIQVTETIESMSAAERVEAGQTIYYDQQADAGQVQQATPSPVIANKPIEEQLDDSVSAMLQIFVWSHILAWAYLIGLGVMLLSLIVRLVRLSVKLHSLEYTQHEGYRLAMVDGDQPAFSFFRTVVIGRDHFSEAEIQQLLGHELVHVRRHHTLDVLFCEVMKVVFWFNPFVWLTERELKRVHEFQADEQMMSGDDATTYAELLYHQISGKRYSLLGNNFDYRITKKRIKMLQQHKNRWGSLSLIVVLPVLALMLFAQCEKKQVLEGTFHISKISLMNDDDNNTELWCWQFFNLQDREFTFHTDGTVDVKCRKDSSADFTGIYTLDKKEGLRIYSADQQLWLDMYQVTNFCDGDTISITYTDNDPMHGLETMLNTLALKEYLDTLKGTWVKRPNDTIEWVSTVYPEITVGLELNSQDSSFFYNRMLRASNGYKDWKNVGTTQLLYENGDTIPYYIAGWEYPEGKLHADAQSIYDNAEAEEGKINPKRDDYKFQLRVEMKRK